MANTYTALANVTVGSGGTASISFTNISQSYTDLVVILSTRSSVSGINDYPKISFNGSSSSQTLRALTGNGSSASSYTDTLIYTVGSGNTQTSNTFGNSVFYIPNYTNTSINKSVSSDAVNENNASTATQGLFAGLWSNTSAITSITIIPYNASQTFLQHSTATLYGISNT